jgi:hypothetical protein
MASGAFDNDNAGEPLVPCYSAPCDRYLRLRAENLGLYKERAMTNTAEQPVADAIAVPKPVDRGPIDPRILSISPNLAIEWGYNLYLAEVLEQNSETRISAVKAVREIEQLVETFAQGTRERLYLTTLRLAANSFAQGVERRKRSRIDSIDSAKQAKDDGLKRCTRDTRRGGLLSGGFKLLIMGGFIFSLVRVVFGLPAVSQHNAGIDVHYVSVCTALGIALIGAYIKAWWTDRKMVSLFKEYDEKVTKANETYADEVVNEYRFAAQTAETAWHQLTDAPAPMTKAFEALLLGVIKGYAPSRDGKAA